MKKLRFLAAILLLALCNYGIDLRMDVYGLPEKGDAQGISDRAVVTLVDRGELKFKTATFPSGDEWQPFEIKITPAGAENLTIHFRSTSKEKLLIDDITVSGGTLENCGFEEITSKDRFKAWKSKKSNIVTNPELVHSGKSAATVTYSDRIAQTLKVASTEVVLRGFTRREMPLGQTGANKIPADANVVFDPTIDISAPLIISVGRLELHPTFENCGVYINRLPEERGKMLSVAFFFRKQGDKDFQEALPPSEIKQENAWRGSLLKLTEDTKYEFKAIITGENGYKSEITDKFQTLNSQVPSETCILPPGPMKTTIISGKPEKYMRYTSNGAKITSPGQEVQAIFNLEDKEYIIFENMAIDARGAQICFNLLNSRNIIIRNCEIYNFGRIAVDARYGIGEYYSGGPRGKNGELLYDDLAFKLQKSQNVLIEKCLVHDPTFSAQTWVHAHPSGAGCIKVTDCKGTVIRWNDFAGRDKARFVDHIIGPPNTALRGGFARDADIYGNLFVFSNDDGAELEGGGMNIRCYGNRIEGTLSGISTGPISLGPCYVMENLFANPGDDTGSYGQPYKNGGGKPGLNHTRGTLYLLHNTVSDTWLSTYGVGCFSIPHKDYFPICKAYMRNNIMRASGSFFHRLWPTFRTDCDGDLMERIIFPDEDPEKVKSWMEKSAEYIKQANIEKHGIYGKTQFVAPRRGNYALKPGTDGYKQAMKINNCSIRHVGAYEGYEGEWFPKRPLDLTGDRTELHWGKGDSSQRNFTITPGKTLKGKFTVFVSDNFFSVTPKTGTFVPGKKLTFAVNLNPDAMKEPKRYTGVIIVRNEDGLSYPVTIFADRRIPIKELLADHLRFIPAKRISDDGKNQVYEVNVPQAATQSAPWFMLIKGVISKNKAKGKADFVFDGKKNYDFMFPLIHSGGFMTLRSADFSRLHPLYLHEGLNTFEFQNLKDVDVECVILTREPETLVRNRDYPIKVEE